MSSHWSGIVRHGLRAALTGLGLRKEFPGSHPPCAASTVCLCCGAPGGGGGVSPSIRESVPGAPVRARVSFQVQVQVQAGLLVPEAVGVPCAVTTRAPSRLPLRPVTRPESPWDLSLRLLACPTVAPTAPTLSVRVIGLSLSTASGSQARWTRSWTALMCPRCPQAASSPLRGRSSLCSTGAEPRGPMAGSASARTG